jgi:hypothetical protein
MFLILLSFICSVFCIVYSFCLEAQCINVLMNSKACQMKGEKDGEEHKATHN